MPLTPQQIAEMDKAAGLTPEKIAAMDAIAYGQQIPQTAPANSNPNFDAFNLGVSDVASFGLDPKIRGLGYATGVTLGEKLGLRPSTDTSFGQLYEQGKQAIKQAQKSASENNKAAYIGGQITGAVLPSILSPSTGLGNWAKVEGKLGQTALRSGALSAAPAGLYGYNVGEGNQADKFKSAASYAAPASVLGGAIPLAGAALKSVGNAVSPAVSEAGAKVAELAKKYNIPMGLDDLTDSSFYKTLISEGKTLPFAGAQNKSQAQMSAWMRGINKSIGAEGDKLSPEVVLNRFDELGKQIDDFFKGKKINLGEDYGLGLRQRDFIDSVAENYAAEGKNVIEKYTGQINKAIQKDGVIDGEALGKIRNRVSKIGRESKNPEISGAARDVEKFIIDAVSNVSEIGSKEAFKKAKYQYKNLIALEPLAQDVQMSGEISPARLLTRVRQVYGREFSKGRAGELGDLANIGQYIKETIPNSGTSQRTMARNILTGNLMGSLPTLAFGGLPAAAAQAGLSGLAFLANRGLQSRNFNPALIEKGLSKMTPAIEQKATESALKALTTKAPQIIKEKK